MELKEFKFWLLGFLKNKTKLEKEDIDTILEQIKETEPKTSLDNQWIYPKIPSKIDTPKLPTMPDNIWQGPYYFEKCSCNPKNGGSGICGCTLFKTTVTSNTKDILKG